MAVEKLVPLTIIKPSPPLAANKFSPGASKPLPR